MTTNMAELAYISTCVWSC